tara:strand:- start:11268 stop:12335 length:1068 start_codon:yes stop_codon:yes gene_type:complete
MMTDLLPPALVTAFERQQQACRALGSDFTALVCQSIGELGLPDSTVRQTIAGWPGDPSSQGDSVPLRLCGALHELVITRSDEELAKAYPPHSHGMTPKDLHPILCRAIDRHQRRICARLQSPPQTNEIRRAAAIYAGLNHIARKTDLPFVLSEVGASAGLNLLLDQFSYRFGPIAFGKTDAPVHLEPDWTGPVPPPAAFTIEERRGCDLSPFDLADAGDRARLLSYVWPDQPDRLERLRAALFLAKQTPFTVDACDAVQWLDIRLKTPRPGKAHVIYHTIAWQYLDERDKQAGLEIIENAGAKSCDDAPLFVLGMEADNQHRGAALRLRSWPGGMDEQLGRVDFHGRWIAWNAVS